MRSSVDVVVARVRPRKVSSIRARMARMRAKPPSWRRSRLLSDMASRASSQYVDCWDWVFILASVPARTGGVQGQGREGGPRRDHGLELPANRGGPARRGLPSLDAAAAGRARGKRHSDLPD